MVRTRHAEKESPFTVYVPKPSNPLDGMPKRPSATPIQNSETPTSFIDTSPPTSFINTSPSRSKAGANTAQKGTSPSVSFITSSPRSGETIIGGRSASGSPFTPPLQPTLAFKSASSAPYLTVSSPQPPVPTTPPLSSYSPLAAPVALPSNSSFTSPASGPTPIARSSTMMSTKSTKSSRKRPQPQRAGSTGIGAGLGIMGLGMGMGVGMGVGIGVTGGRTSMDGDVPATGEMGERLTEKGKEKEGSSGVKAWLKRATMGSSRPGTPTSPVVGVASS
ncbi:hypothetical protein H0H87_002380 [Tephrocybe sp. NHM501043]|nr:hypothetical protein H0H87_002380 [Tephrocybe sp. NHM501043]